MVVKIKNRLAKVLLGIFLILLLASCHYKYLNLEIKTNGSISWNNDSSAFVFVAEKKLYKMPKGIAKFPDGGKSKNEYLDFAIYHFNIRTKKLTHLTDLNEFYIVNTYHWLSIKQVLLSLKDTELFYKMKYPYNYDLKTIKERQPEFLSNVVKTYKINLVTLQKYVVDTTIYKHLFDKKQEYFKSSLAKRYLSNLKCLDWGIDIEKLYPQSKNTYIDYIVKKRGNSKFKACIFNQILSNFSQKDRKSIMAKMQKYKQELYKRYISLDEKKDPYRRSLAKSGYEDYILYMKDIETKLLTKQKENLK